jgi:hypothetical protein
LYPPLFLFWLCFPIMTGIAELYCRMKVDTHQTPHVFYFILFWSHTHMGTEVSSHLQPFLVKYSGTLGPPYVSELTSMCLLLNTSAFMCSFLLFLVCLVLFLNTLVSPVCFTIFILVNGHAHLHFFFANHMLWFIHTDVH